MFKLKTVEDETLLETVTVDKVETAVLSGWDTVDDSTKEDNNHERVTPLTTAVVLLPISMVSSGALKVV